MLLFGQLARRAGMARLAPAVRASGTLSPLPEADGRVGDAQAAGDLGLGDALAEPLELQFPTVLAGGDGAHGSSGTAGAGTQRIPSTGHATPMAWLDKDITVQRAVSHVERRPE